MVGGRLSLTLPQKRDGSQRSYRLIEVLWTFKGDKKSPKWPLRALKPSYRKHPEAQPLVFSLIHPPVVCKTGRMPTVLLLQIQCRWCRCFFSVWRSCFRGQAYCCDSCRVAAKRENHRKAQRRYRQTLKGKKAHREAENRRRHGWSKKSEKNMDDATSTVLPSRCINRFMQTNNHILGRHESPRCQFCGSSGQIVAAFPRRGYG